MRPAYKRQIRAEHKEQAKGWLTTGRRNEGKRKKGGNGRIEKRKEVMEKGCEIGEESREGRNGVASPQGYHKSSSQ